MKKVKSTGAPDAPDNYKPRSPQELIGPAREVATVLLKEMAEAKHAQCVKRILLYGDAGNGKTCLSEMLARFLAQGAVDITSINGGKVTVDVVRAWQKNACYASLFGGWKVTLIHEVDLVLPLAQDLMLTFLDELPSQTAIFAASNMNVGSLTERFQTRFRLVHVENVSAVILARWLTQRWNVPEAAANFIALDAGGNVRNALAQAANFRTFRKVIKRPVTTTANWRAMRAADARKQRHEKRQGKIAKVLG